MGFSGGTSGEEQTVTAGDGRDMGSVSGGIGKIPWRRAWQPTPVFLPGESNGQRSLEGYSPWGLKGLDTTEETNVPMHTHDLFFSLSVPHSLGQEASKNLGRCS